jgi:hypothetical protein
VSLSSSQDIDYFKSEIQNDINDFKSYLQLQKSGVSNSVQFRLVFKSKLDAFQIKLRELILQKDLNNSIKINIVQDVLPIIYSTLNLFPDTDDFVNEWMDLSLACNFFMLNLCSLGRSNEEWKLRAAANILSEILLGVPKIEKLPEPNKFQDKKYNLEIFRFRNALTMNSGVFIESIITLYDISYENYTEWVSNAFWNFKKYNDFYSQLNKNISFYGLNKDAQKDFETIRMYLMPLWNSLVMILNVTKTFGFTWPKGIETYDLFEKSLSGIVLYFKQVQEEYQEIFDKLSELKHDKIYSNNDDPFSSPHTIRLQLIMDYIKIYLDLIENYAKINLNLVEVSKSEVDRETLKALLHEIFDFKSTLDKNLPEGISVANSQLSAYYIDLLDLILEVSIQAEQDLDKSVVELITTEKEFFSDAYFRLIKLQILESFRSQKEIDVDKVLEELEYLKTKNQYKYRENLDIHVLQFFVLFYVGKEINILNTINDLEAEINEITSNKKLVEYFKRYLKYLKGEVENFPNEYLKHVKLDYNTWYQNLPVVQKSTGKSLLYTPLQAFQFKVEKIED